MKLLPLFIFWCLWFLNFSTRSTFSPILPLVEDSLSLSYGEAGGLFTSYSIGYSVTLFVTGRFGSVYLLSHLLSSWSGRHLKIDLPLRAVNGHRSDYLHWGNFWNGGTPFLLGVIADHSSFKVGIQGLGILTAFSSSINQYDHTKFFLYPALSSNQLGT